MTKDEFIYRILEMDENTFNDFLSFAKKIIDNKSSEQESKIYCPKLKKLSVCIRICIR